LENPKIEERELPKDLIAIILNFPEFNGKGEKKKPIRIHITRDVKDIQ